MKRLIPLLLVLLSLSSCIITAPKAVFTFDNQSTSDITIVPASGEDWASQEFTVAQGTQEQVESDKNNLIFTAHVDGAAGQEVQPTYDDATRTFLFEDPPLPVLP